MRKNLRATALAASSAAAVALATPVSAQAISPQVVPQAHVTSAHTAKALTFGNNHTSTRLRVKAGRNAITATPSAACSPLRLSVTSPSGRTRRAQGPGPLTVTTRSKAGTARVSARAAGRPSAKCRVAVAVHHLVRAGQVSVASTARVEAERYSSMTGVYVEPCSDTGGGYDLAGIRNGEWAKYASVPMTTDQNQISVRLANATSLQGSIEVHRDSTTGPLLATVPVTGTGGWQTWRTVTAKLSVPTAGTYNVALVFRSASKSDFVNVNWFELSGPDTTAPPSGAVTPESFGAVGDGVADDTAALQRAFDSLQSGSTLWLAAGKTYRHSQVLRIAKPGITIGGTGTLLATDESKSAVMITANNVTMDGPTIKLASTTKRWVAYEQMGLLLRGYDGIIVRNVTVSGSAAAGIYVGGATNFTLQDVTVKDTRADGIHMTEGASYGQVIRPTVLRSGDDGVAVVSYLAQSKPTSNITVTGAIVRDQVWGRAFSVVGGQNVTYRDIRSESSAGAAVYIASESEYATYGVSNVLVDGATLVYSNQQAAISSASRPSPNEGRVVQGAVLVYNSLSSTLISDVTMRNVTIKDTDAEAYDQVQMRSANGGTIQRMTFDYVTVTGGYPSACKTTNVPGSAYNTRYWTLNGTALANHIGW